MHTSSQYLISLAISPRKRIGPADPILVAAESRGVRSVQVCLSKKVGQLGDEALATWEESKGAKGDGSPEDWQGPC